MSKIAKFKLNSLNESQSAFASSYSLTAAKNLVGNQNEVENAIDTGNVAIRLGENKAGTRFSSCAIFRTDTIPPRSKIISAKINMRSAAAYGSNQQIDMGIMVPDGRWERFLQKAEDRINLGGISPENPNVWTSDSAFNSLSLTLRDVSTVIGATDATVNELYPIARTVADPISGDTLVTNLGWTTIVQCDSAGTLTNIAIELQPQGSPTGSYRMRLFPTITDENGILVPFDHQLARSNSVLAESMGAGLNIITFSFPVGQQVALSAGTYYAVQIFPFSSVGDFPVYDNTNYLQVGVDTSNINAGYDSNEKVFSQGRVDGLATGNYPSNGSFPTMYILNTGTTTSAQNPPHNGNIVEGVMVSSTSGAGEIISLEGLGNVLQEWLWDPRYELIKNQVGFHFESADYWATNSLQDYYDLELEVEYQPRKVTLN